MFNFSTAGLPDLPRRKCSVIAGAANEGRKPANVPWGYPAKGRDTPAFAGILVAPVGFLGMLENGVGTRRNGESRSAGSVKQTSNKAKDWCLPSEQHKTTANIFGTIWSLTFAESCRSHRYAEG